MVGKKTLKQVQVAGEQLLSLGKQIAEQQKKANVLKVDQATSANPLFEVYLKFFSCYCVLSTYIQLVLT